MAWAGAISRARMRVLEGSRGFYRRINTINGKLKQKRYKTHARPELSARGQQAEHEDKDTQRREASQRRFRLERLSLTSNRKGVIGQSYNRLRHNSQSELSSVPTYCRGVCVCVCVLLYLGVHLCVSVRLYVFLSVSEKEI